MKILVITLNAWNDTGSTGNTISNIFRNATDSEFANIYCRNEVINNLLCKKYYQITEEQILLHFLGKSAGRAFNLLNAKYDCKVGFNPLANGGLGNVLRRFRPSSLLFLRELIWILPFWKNHCLNKFLTDFRTDIIYMHAHANLYMHNLMEYCAKVTGAKVVLFFGDDMYGRKSKAPIGYMYETLYRKRLYKSIQSASLLFGGSVKLCTEYSNIFGREFIPMFKECNLENLSRKSYVNNPIKIVYAGNLLFGREKEIINLLIQIREVNQITNGFKIQLFIYSNTLPNKKFMNILDDKVCSFYMGCKPYLEVCTEMNNADLSLFIESFASENINKTRLSFSTKIIDCMQSGSAMLAIGPSNIASMEYIMQNSIGLSACSLQEIKALLLSISNNPQIILDSGETKYAFAKKNHTNTSFVYLNKIMKLI